MVHIDNSTRPDVRHLLAIQGSDLSEETRTHFVTAVLSEKHGDIEVLELFGTNVVAGFREAGFSAPRIDVVAPEVDGIFAISTVEVVGEVLNACQWMPSKR